jgi:ABC-2 type transport system permease protein
MRLFWEFLIFELKFRLKSISTYIYFLLWLAFGFLNVASESFGPVGNSNGKVLLNGPYANYTNFTGASFFGLIIVAAIFGTSILRDFQRDTYQMIFTKPISKFAYLGGRWGGSLITCLFVFSGNVVGATAGTLAPWTDHTRIANAPMIWYLQPFFTVLVVQIFFLGSTFFAVAALSRRIFIVYLQGVLLFVLYLIGSAVFQATNSLDRFWSTIFDPVGLLALNNITRYWTVAEKNSSLIAWSGAFLYNRLLWTSVGFLALAGLWAFFPMSVEALTARSQGRRAAKEKLIEEEDKRPVRSLVVARLPRVEQVFDRSSGWAQFVSLTRMRISNIVREIPFWAILVMTAVICLTNGYFAGHINGANVWPVTYLMLASVEGGSVLFAFIVAFLYAAELLWRERDTGFDGIHDALPLRETPDWFSKLTALAFVAAVVLAVAMISGMTMQTFSGYYHYEVGQYLKELYVVTFPQIMIYALLALFVQTLVSNKFIGHAIVIGVFLAQNILFSFGIENSLLLFGQTTPYIYSDMNGYGHYVPALFWSILYWLAIASFLGVISIAMARRGAETAWPARMRLAAGRMPALVPGAVVCLLVATGSGSWFFYNAHVLNEFLPAAARRKIQAEYERSYKKYERQDMPKVTALDTTINIFPERRSFGGSVRMTLQNKTTAPIREVHITDEKQSVSNLKFDRAADVVGRPSPRNLYTVYRFAQPLAPGETTVLTCNVGHESRGFRDGNELAEFAYNGTFFDVGYLPSIGYDRGFELDDPRRRREEHLPALEEMAPRGDARYSRLNLFTEQSDWITYHTVVSTSSDQIAISPGYLQKQWTSDGRNYYEYSMGGTHIQDFASWISGRYKVKREPYKGVAIEVYYNKGHDYQIGDMIAATKAGLDYDQANYSPYQFSQYRVLEYPRYRNFAQSFPNTIPFSEGIGFIGRVQKKTDIDFAYFVTAHELGHQWWGHQLIGGNVQGSNMMSESLAEYSALRIMARRYGEYNMRRFLKYELNGYLRGRAGEVRHEPPLALVQREAYVWYQKGSVVLYALADYIGEDKLNEALGEFLREYRYANANNQVAATNNPGDAADNSHTADKPYPDTRQFVAALRSRTPAELQYFITDNLENITLYDNKAVSAVATRRADGKYDVKITVQASKMRADGDGKETPVAMQDLIDIGVFDGSRDEAKALALVRKTVTGGTQVFDLVVDGKPVSAGIDPLNKLIDRNSEDNRTAVTIQ